MAAPKRQPAMTVFWQSPAGQACSLAPLAGSHGILEVDVVESQVIIHGRNCVQRTWTTDEEEAEEQAFSEIELSLPLTRCQINWNVLEKKEADEVERSIHFKD